MPYALFDYVPGGPHTMGEMGDDEGDIQPVIGDRTPYDVFPVSGVMPMGWQYDPSKSKEENEDAKQKALYEDRKRRYGGADAPAG